MATYVTGRERNVTVSGTTAGDVYNNNIYLQQVPFETFAKTPSGSVNALGVSITFETGVFGPQGKGPFRSWIGERVTITLPLNLGSAQHHDLRQYVAPAPYQGSMAGTWQIQATLQECVEVVEESVNAGEQLPKPIRLRFYERLKPGSTLSASASCGGASTTISAQVPAGGLDVIASHVVASAVAFVENDGDSLYECSATVTYNLPSTPSDPAYSRTATQSGGRYYEAQVSASQTRALARLTAGHTATTAQSQVTGTLYAPKTATCSFRVTAIDVDYPVGLVAKLLAKKDTWTDVQVVGGTGTHSIEQKRWTCSSSFDGNANTNVLDEWDSVRAYLASNSLADAGEDIDATRLFGHGWRYDALSVDHATRTVLDTCDSLANSAREWVAVQQCTLAAGGGIITITPTGPQPVVRRSCLTPPAERLNSYAFLRLRVRASVNDAPLTLVVGGKRYQKTTGVSAGTWADVYFDLCAPSNATQPYDQQTSVYPEGRPDGEYWGVTQTGEIRLELANATYDIDEVSLDVFPWTGRTPPYNVPNHSICVMPARGWWVQRVANRSVRRLVTGQSDGKQALELEDAEEVNGVPTQRTIADLHAEVNASEAGIVRWLGWSSSLLAPAPSGCSGSFDPLRDCFLNRDRPATWLCGAGLTYDGSNWTPWAGRVNLPASLLAQALYDQVDWFPGIGDVWEWGNGQYGSALKIAWGAVLRSRAFGLALDVNGNRLTSGIVELQHLASGQSGGTSSLAGWQGAYETGASYAKGQQDYRLVGSGAAAALVPSSRRYYTRIPLRTVPRAAVVHDWQAVECDSPRAVLMLASPQKMEHYHQATGELVQQNGGWDDLKPLLVRYDQRWDATLSIWSQRQVGGTLKVVRSWDRMVKAGEVLVMTANSAVLETISARGIIALLWENGGNVQVQYSYDAGQTWTAPQNALLNGAAFTGELLDSDYDPRWDAIYLVRKTGSTVQLLVSYDAGATWGVLVA